MHRWLPLLLALLAMALALPSVWTGWQQDDLVQRYFLLGYPDYKGDTVSPLELFHFLSGDPERARALMDLGIIPWWTLETVRLSFWRPLAAATQWIDYRLWPDSGPMMHLHSLVWFGAVVIAATVFYRRYLGAGWVAGLAALFYAIDDARGLPAGWLASRNALLCIFFGLLVLLFHDRWRRDRWRPGAYLGLVFLLLGLLSGEATLGVIAYLVAYALVLDPGTWRQKIWSLSPYASITLGWLIYYRLQGHGTRGSGFYIDLMSEPMQFALAFAVRGPILLLDQWAIPPSSLYMFLPPAGIALFSLAALLFLVLLAFLLFPLLRQEKMARFLAVGMVLSLPLVCSVMPHSRLLFFVGIGGMGLLALWMGGLGDRAAWVPAGRSWRLLARVIFVLFVLVHLVIAPLFLPVASTAADFAERYIQHPAESEVLRGDLSQQDLVIVNPPMAFQAHYLPTARTLEGKSAPRRLRVLAPGLTGLDISRPDERSLLVRPGGGYFNQPFDNVFRGPAHPMRLGERVVLTNMTVEITELTDDGRPAAATFGFPFPLEDAELRWVKWEDGTYVRFNLPEVGTSLSLPAEDLEF